MGTYEKMSVCHQKRIDDIPFIFACNEDQFQKEKERLGVKSNSELVRIQDIGLIRKVDLPRLNNTLKLNKEEREAAMKDYDFCVSMFRYELNNHEYCFTGNDREIFDACHLTADEVNASEMLKKAFETAKRKYLRTVRP